MKFLIVGLGNIGPEYFNTRHNIGFKVLDALAGASNISFSAKRYGDVAELKHRGRIFVLLKPSTFMNRSGKAVNYWLKKERIPVENLLIVTDDIALPIGALRLRKKGGDGGHNGLYDIIDTLGTQDFARLRVGIGGDFPKGNQVHYVMGELSEEENQEFQERYKTANQMILGFGTIGIELAMTRYNRK